MKDEMDISTLTPEQDFHIAVNLQAKSLKDPWKLYKHQ